MIELNEAEVIDISIKDIKKVVKKGSDIDQFLSDTLKIEEKTDGVKVTLFLREDADDKKSVDENWDVAYKGNILKSSEFGHNTPDEAKMSQGASQFMFIFKHLETVSVKSLPKGYQFFCEYLINKPTLMSQYTKLYKLILLAYGKSSCKETNGILQCSKSNFEFDFEERKALADILEVYTPPVVFEGKLHPTTELIRGLNSDIVKKVFVSELNNLKGYEDNKELYYKEIINVFLRAESQFGGSPEGYVTEFKNTLVKFQQEYQLSKEERTAKKNQFKGTIAEEAVYWTEIKDEANRIISNIKIKDITKIFSEISKQVQKVSVTHPKKNIETIKDDLFLTAKMNILKQLAPKTALIIGKMNVLTIKHQELIQKALDDNEILIIALSTARGKDKTKQIRTDAILKTFKKDAKRIDIVYSINGFIPQILNKSIYGIGLKSVYAGTDRVGSYEDQVQTLGNDIKVIELDRTDSVISSSDIIDHLDDELYFKTRTPKEIWGLYSDYIKIYSK